MHCTIRKCVIRLTWCNWTGFSGQSNNSIRADMRKGEKERRDWAQRRIECLTEQMFAMLVALYTALIILCAFIYCIVFYCSLQMLESRNFSQLYSYCWPCLINFIVFNLVLYGIGILLRFTVCSFFSALFLTLVIILRFFPSNNYSFGKTNERAREFGTRKDKGKKQRSEKKLIFFSLSYFL